MTDRLYLRDPYLTRFSARVVSLAEVSGRPAAVLDRSAFYPEGGGQPGDRGSLSGAAVLDVQEREGVVLHVLDRPLDAGDVEGVVDWQRRFDHMQQHHGQHLLSAAFERVQGDRVVLVEGVDASPCGGTHPSRTGEVGAIAVLGAQKWGSGKARVEFVCGNRIVKLLAEQGRWLTGAAEALKCAVRDLPESARRAADEAVARRKAAEALEKDLARMQAAELAAKGSPAVARVERASLARALAGAPARRARSGHERADQGVPSDPRRQGRRQPRLRAGQRGARPAGRGAGGGPRTAVIRKPAMRIRHDWTLPEVRALHDLPLLELVHRAQAVHREVFRDNKVQLCSLLSIKTGGCPEDCAYC